MEHIDWDTVSEDDLPEHMQELAREAGIEAVRALVSTFSGTTLYVPSLRDLRRRQMARRAADLERQGFSRAEVCRHLKVSRRTLNGLLQIERQ